MCVCALVTQAAEVRRGVWCLCACLWRLWRVWCAERRELW
jgi:hypothetical protein